MGSQEILDAQEKGLSYEDIRSLVMNEVRHHFRPEFLNRVDEIVVFHPLSEEELGKVVEIQLTRVRERLADRRISLEVTPAAVRQALPREGMIPVFGARPLKRLIQHDIENPLSVSLVKGEIKDGDTVIIDLKDDQIIVRPRWL